MQLHSSYSDTYHGTVSKVFTSKFDSGEITRFQIISFPLNHRLIPVRNTFSPQVLDSVSTLCRNHLMPKLPELGLLVLTVLPKGAVLPFPRYSEDGTVFLSDQARNRYWLNRCLKDGAIVKDGERLRSRQPDVQEFLELLYRTNSIRTLVSDSGSAHMAITVSPRLGYLNSHFSHRRIVLNSHFFLMDLTDLDSVFDCMGEPYGLSASGGEIFQPPLYSRSALFYDHSSVSISTVGIRDTEIYVDDRKRVHGDNCEVYLRPEMDISPIQQGLDLAIVNREIVGYKKGGGLSLPEAGYVLHLNSSQIPDHLQVRYSMSQLSDFGVQAGPAMIKDSVSIEGFEEPYYHGEGIYYPPTGFPLCWDTGLAARMGLGVRKGKLVIVWVEGNKPAVYRPGIDSRGFSLAEFTETTKMAGIEQCVNLDGGGSSQLGLGQNRVLRISDRDFMTGEDFERPVPTGLILDL